MKKRFLGVITPETKWHPLGGPISECDVGKAFYRIDGHVYIENDA